MKYSHQRQSYQDFQREVKRFREVIWSLFREYFYGNKPTCLDCGKELSENEGVIMVDSKGFVCYCNEHTMTRIKIKETWEKVFRE